MSRRRYVLVLSAISIAIGVQAAACSSAGRPARPTSAEILNAGSTDRRTVDNSGYVTPSGQTRQVTAGAGPSTIGRGDGVPPPRRETPALGGPPAPPASRPPPNGGTPAPASVAVTELSERVARAACDREMACGRIGGGRPFESPDACLAALRARVHRGLDASSCGEVIRGDRMQACIVGIQEEPCTLPMTFARPPACTGRILCGE